MAERQIEISGKVVSPLSQRQIAEITGLAYKTVNNIIKELRNSGYIAYEGTSRGKYSLTDKAKTIITEMSTGGSKNG